MKKILPLIALLILFATACKKDKNEPEPASGNIEYYSDQMVGTFKYSRMIERNILFGVPKGYLGNYYDSLYNI